MSLLMSLPMPSWPPVTLGDAARWGGRALEWELGHLSSPPSLAFGYRLHIMPMIQNSDTVRVGLSCLTPRPVIQLLVVW